MKLNPELYKDRFRFHPATWLRYLDLELKRRENIELHIITVTRAVNKDLIFQEGNTTYHFIKASQPPLPDYLSRLFFYLELIFFHRFAFTIPKVRKTLKKINPDIINVHGTENNYALCARGLNIPVLINMQGVINIIVKTANTIHYRRSLRVENKILKYFKHYITVKGNMEDVILSKNPEAIFYNLFYPITDSAFELNKKRIAKYENDVIYVGTIKKLKGIEDLINATALAKKTIPDISVSAIGMLNEDYRFFLERKIQTLGIEKNFRLIGYIESHEQIMRSIRTAKIFVLPTYIDSGPRSVAESMAIGTPVISYNVDGLPAMITNNHSGILVEVGNVNQLAQQMVSLLKDTSYREKIAQNAFAFAENNFKVNAIVDKTISIYSNIISSK